MGEVARNLICITTVFQKYPRKCAVEIHTGTWFCTKNIESLKNISSKWPSSILMHKSKSRLENDFTQTKSLSGIVMPRLCDFYNLCFNM